MNAIRPLRAIVVCDDRHHAVVQTEDRHEDKALELKVGSEHGDGGGGEGDQDQIHNIGRERGDARHQNGWDADTADFPHQVEIRSDMTQLQRQIVILAMVENDRNDSADTLTEHRGPRSAGDTQFGKAKQTEDQNGVKHNVDDGAGELGNHRVDRAASRLKEALKCDLNEDAERANETDAQIDRAKLDDLLNVGLRAHVRLHAENADEQDQKEADGLQNQPLYGDLIGALRIFLTECAGEQRIDADAEADRNRDHHILQRKCHGDGGQRVFTDARDKDAVHDVVQRLHQH